MVQFFTMHEILHTYRFWVFDEKTHSLLFMLREEEFSFIATIPSVLMKIIQTSWKIFRSCIPKINIVSPSCAICRMMYDAYAMQNDVMMLCYEKRYSFRSFTHIPAIKYIIFFVSALTFRCKLCIPLGTSLELLRLLLSAESALTFRCKLCIPLGTSSELFLFFSFGTRWCALSFYMYIFGGFCSYKTKKKNYMWWPH